MMSAIPSARAILRYIKKHPGRTLTELKNDIFRHDYKIAIESLKSVSEYLWISDSRSGEFRDINAEILGEKIYFINPKGVDYLREHFSVEAKFWITLFISVTALVISIICNFDSISISLPTP